jgi:hypothetical protein
VTKSYGPASIDHYNRDKVITVGANVQGRPLSDVQREAQKRIAALKLPPGVHLSQGGDVSGRSFTSAVFARSSGARRTVTSRVLPVGSTQSPASTPANDGRTSGMVGMGASGETVRGMCGTKRTSKTFSSNSPL